MLYDAVHCNAYTVTQFCFVYYDICNHNHSTDNFILPSNQALFCKHLVVNCPEFPCWDKWLLLLIFLCRLKYNNGNILIQSIWLLGTHTLHRSQRKFVAPWSDSEISGDLFMFWSCSQWKILMKRQKLCDQ